MHESFWVSLRKRKIVRWALTYLAAAWVFLEFCDFLRDTFEWPATVLRVITVLVAFSFLGVLVMAWYHGEKGHQRARPSELVLLAAIAVAAGGIAWQVAESRMFADATPAPAAPSGAEPATLAMADRADFDPSSASASVAVLPFADYSAEPGNDYFGDGMTEDIIARLGRLGSLRVISRTSAMHYKGTTLTLRQIGQELGVDAILEGSVRREGNRVRIVAQLIDARTDEHLWAETYDRTIDDLFAIQSDVAEKIASAMQATLTPLARELIQGAPTSNPEAYGLFLQGRQLAASDRPADRAAAAGYFAHAIELDSTFALAYAALAETADTPAEPAVPPPAGAPASPAAPNPPGPLGTALRLDPESGEVQRMAGRRRALRDADMDGAEAAARKAIRINPNDAEARRLYSRILMARGDERGALRELRIASSLDPMSAAVHSELGELMTAMGQVDSAMPELHRALRIDSTAPGIRVNLGLAFDALGMADSALAQIREAAANGADDPMVLSHLGAQLARSGRTEEARAVLADLRRRAEKGAAPAIAVAQVYLALGDRDAALEWLSKPGAAGRAMLDPSLAHRFAELKTDPRFRRLFRHRPAPADSPATR